MALAALLAGATAPTASADTIPCTLDLVPSSSTCQQALQKILGGDDGGIWSGLVRGGDGASIDAYITAMQDAGTMPTSAGFLADAMPASGDTLAVGLGAPEFIFGLTVIVGSEQIARTLGIIPAGATASPIPLASLSYSLELRNDGYYHLGVLTSPASVWSPWVYPYAPACNAPDAGTGDGLNDASEVGDPADSGEFDNAQVCYAHYGGNVNDEITIAAAKYAFATQTTSLYTFQGADAVPYPNGDPYCAATSHYDPANGKCTPGQLRAVPSLVGQALLQGVEGSCTGDSLSGAWVCTPDGTATITAPTPATVDWSNVITDIDACPSCADQVGTQLGNTGTDAGGWYYNGADTVQYGPYTAPATAGVVTTRLECTDPGSDVSWSQYVDGEILTRNGISGLSPGDSFDCYVDSSQQSSPDPNRAPSLDLAPAVATNPQSFIFGTPSGTAPATDPTTDGTTGTAPACSNVDVGSIDFTPLENVSLGDHFPFGVFTWIYGGIDGWTGTVAAPVFNVPLLGLGNGRYVHVDMSIFDPFMPTFRALMLLMFTVLAVYGFATSALGFGGGGGSSE